MEVKITQNKKNKYLYSINFKDLTEGELLSLFNALSLRATQSPVCLDVYNLSMRSVQKDFPEFADKVAILDSWKNKT